MGYFWENETGTAEVGEVLTIPAGIRHTFFSADPEQPLEFEVTLKPAVRLRLVYGCRHAACPSTGITACCRLVTTTVIHELTSILYAAGPV